MKSYPTSLDAAILYYRERMIWIQDTSECRCKSLGKQREKHSQSQSSNSDAIFSKVKSNHLSYCSFVTIDPDTLSALRLTCLKYQICQYWCFLFLAFWSPLNSTQFVASKGISPFYDFQLILKPILFGFNAQCIRWWWKGFFFFALRFVKSAGEILRRWSFFSL